MTINIIEKGVKMFLYSVELTEEMQQFKKIFESQVPFQKKY